MTFNRNSLCYDDSDIATSVEDCQPTTVELRTKTSRASRRHLRVLPTVTSLQTDSSAETEIFSQSISDALDSGSLNTILDNAWVKADRELCAYLDLGFGWDGYDAAPFQVETVRVARDFLTDLISVCRQAEVAPLGLYPGPVADGSIQIEAKVGDRYLLGTFRAGSGDVGIYRESGGADVEEQASLGSSDLAARLAWLVGAVSL